MGLRTARFMGASMYHDLGMDATERDRRRGNSASTHAKGMRRSARQIARTIFRREMRVLRHAGETRELAWRDELLKLLPQGFPTLRKSLFGRSAEKVVGEVARAERREEGE